MYGFVHRDDRDSALADFSNYLFSFGGDVFKDASAGDFTVTLNSPAARRALDFYLKLGKAGGYPTAGAVSQGQMIQLMATGKAAQTVGIIGAWAQLEDPSKSAVVGKFDAALIPRSADGRHASRAGHWIGAIARNVPARTPARGADVPHLVPDARSSARVHALRRGARARRPGRRELARDPKFRFLKAQSENSKVAKMYAVDSGSGADVVDRFAAAEPVHHRQELSRGNARSRGGWRCRTDRARRPPDRPLAGSDVSVRKSRPGPPALARARLWRRQPVSRARRARRGERADVRVRPRLPLFRHRAALCERPRRALVRNRASPAQSRRLRAVDERSAGACVRTAPHRRPRTGCRSNSGTTTATTACCARWKTACSDSACAASTSCSFTT